ncbi:transcriptional regulator ATRX homolog [Rhodamnia argentea]|uniref:Transcriptional regulator ATRX homolog n=1 Tax=Rhodamnia argentea TaxID=178133 RepID=A0A8B8MQA3_9MYRT|nr:transcriptional regulator ATRX homolog [Rhodamnia argentea]
MGKPSSSTSLKKKRPKASSKVRIKKRSKTKKRSKLKKSFRRHRDSDSYSSDYDSLSPSTASSEEDYRKKSKRRARSSSKKSSRRSKKRSRGQSYGTESSEDLPSRKKRKGSKRDGKLSPRMQRTRKKSKRHVSVSSVSSGSNCSTCAELSSDSGQSESQSYRASSERKDADRWTAEKGKTELKECGYSPRSYSPINHRSISSGDEKMRCSNNSMRLRSVIMVNNEDRELHAYGHKEEISYENDDYPSCKSNDSNDSGGKRELTHHPLIESEVKRQVDIEKNEEAVVSDMNTTAITEDGQKNGNNISSVIVGTIHAIGDNENNISGGSDSNDLESILRQRALDNLKKFRGVHKNTAALSAHKENVDSNKEQSLIASSELSHHKFPEDNVANAPPVEGNGANSDPSMKREFININSNDASLGDKGGKIVPAIRRQSSEVRPDHGNSGFKEGGSTRQSLLKLLHGGTSVANVKQEVIPTFASNTSNPTVMSYTWRRESAKVQAPSKELCPSSGPPQAKPLVTKVIGGKTASETVVTENKVDENEVHEQHASPTPELPSRSESTSGAVSSNKDGNDAKDGPQYQQKTMSVTRGGETIQVNYQVYIPKRAPALARRQLKR